MTASDLILKLQTIQYPMITNIFVSVNGIDKPCGEYDVDSYFDEGDSEHRKVRVTLKEGS